MSTTDNYYAKLHSTSSKGLYHTINAMKKETGECEGYGTISEALMFSLETTDVIVIQCEYVIVMPVNN